MSEWLWHVPSDAEWTILANAIGGTSTLGVKLKSSGGWYVGGAAKDDYGFRGIPGGARYGDKFSSVGIAAYFWSSSEYSATNAWNRSLYSITDSLGHEFGYKREFAYSVRCLEGAGSGASSGGTGTAVPWNSSIRYGSLADSRDGQSYRTVAIGTQTWMAENLNYKVDNSRCYSYNADSCAKYGRLYQWATVMGLDASFNNKLWGGTLPRQGICPNGWHVPSDAEWSTLAAVIGDPVGSQLKSTSDWYNSGSGTDAYGFRAMPGGDVIGEYFTSVGHYGYWWSATERDFSNALHLTIYNFSDSVYHNDLGKIAGFSLRCVQN